MDPSPATRTHPAPQPDSLPDIRLVEADTATRVASAREILLEYRDSLNVDLCFQDFDHEVQHLPGNYAPPGGLMLLALVDGEVAGCGAL